MMPYRRVVLCFILIMLAVTLGIGSYFYLKSGQGEPVVTMGARNQYRVLSLTVAGNSGSATTPLNVNAEIYAVYLDFTSSQTTTDVTVGTNATPSYTFVTETDYYTDTWYYPKVQSTDSGGSAISGEYQRYLVCGDKVKLDVAQATVTSTITAYVYVFEPGD